MQPPFSCYVGTGLAPVRILGSSASGGDPDTLPPSYFPPRLLAHAAHLATARLRFSREAESA